MLWPFTPDAGVFWLYTPHQYTLPVLGWLTYRSQDRDLWFADPNSIPGPNTDPGPNSNPHRNPTMAGLEVMEAVRATCDKVESKCLKTETQPKSKLQRVGGVLSSSS